MIQQQQIKNLFLVDAFPIIYRTSHISDRFNCFDPDRVFSSFDFVHQARFLLQKNASNKIIWLFDADGDYWRSIYFPEYKGHRGSKPESFIKGKELFFAWAKARNVPLLGYPSYEADDIAASIVRLLSKSVNPTDLRTFLVTVDSDWQGLIHDDRFTFFTPYGEPHLRSKDMIWQWLYGKWLKQPKKTQALWAMPGLTTFKSEHIWHWKAAIGDRSDNLPPNTPLGLIDLFNPFVKLWEDERYSVEEDFLAALKQTCAWGVDRQASSELLGVIGEAPVPIIVLDS